MHTMWIPGSPTTSASPLAPEYCCPLRVSNPYSFSLLESSLSPAAPLPAFAWPLRRGRMSRNNGQSKSAPIVEHSR